MKHRILIILGFTLLFLAVITLMATVFHWNALHAESNYWRDMQRLESLFTAKRIDVVLVGSSIASHLHPDTFDSGKLGFVNLGLDGLVTSSALNILEREKVVPKIILVEATDITLSTKSGNDELILKQQNTFNRWLWRFCPAFRPTSRPGSMLYSMFKEGKEEPATADWLVKQHITETQCKEVIEWCEDSGNDIPESIKNNAVVIILRNWQDRGVKIIFVGIPIGRNPKLSQAIYQAARYLKSPVINLKKAADIKGIFMNYTDGVHLDRASSAVCSLWLEEILERKFLNNMSISEIKINDESR